jgi:hypothetical protein
MDYWHGGRRGIAVGEYVRSRHERRREWSALERKAEYCYRRLGWNRSATSRWGRDPQRVYFTIDQEVARGYAVLNTILRAEGGAALYRVQPMPTSSVEPDPDCPEWGCSARRALVLEVVEDPIVMDDDDAHRAVCVKYCRWADGSPMYDYDGYLQPPPEHRATGGTPDQYRHLGRWTPIPPGCGIGLDADGQVTGIVSGDPEQV